MLVTALYYSIIHAGRPSKTGVRLRRAYPCVPLRGRIAPKNAPSRGTHAHTDTPRGDTYLRDLTLGNEDDSRCASRSTPWTSAQSSTFPMESDRRNRRRTRDPSASRSMSVAPTPSPFAADSGGSCPSSAAFRSRLSLLVGGRGWDGRNAGSVSKDSGGGGADDVAHTSAKKGRKKKTESAKTKMRLVCGGAKMKSL